MALEQVTPETLARDAPAWREAREKRAAEIFNAIPFPENECLLGREELAAVRNAKLDLAVLNVAHSYGLNRWYLAGPGARDLTIFPGVIQQIRAEFRRLAANEAR